PEPRRLPRFQSATLTPLARGPLLATEKETTGKMPVPRRRDLSWDRLPACHSKWCPKRSAGHHLNREGFPGFSRPPRCARDRKGNDRQDACPTATRLIVGQASSLSFQMVSKAQRRAPPEPRRLPRFQSATRCARDRY